MKRKQAKGASLLEAAILIPVFILILGGIIDIARWYNLHLQVSRIAYEGARFGASLNGMKRFTGAGADDPEFVPANNDYTIDRQVYERIYILRDSKKIPLEHFTAKAFRKSTASAAIGDVVRVEIVTQYRPFFSSFMFDKDIKIVAQAPYLYRNT